MRMFTTSVKLAPTVCGCGLCRHNFYCVG